jgi:hypothetical protein
LNSVFWQPPSGRASRGTSWSTCSRSAGEEGCLTGAGGACARRLAASVLTVCALLPACSRHPSPSPRPAAEGTQMLAVLPPDAPACGGWGSWWVATLLNMCCRGNIEEGAGGKRRCVGPQDRDLQVVSRHYLSVSRAAPSGDSSNWTAAGSVAASCARR